MLIQKTFKTHYQNNVIYLIILFYIFVWKVYVNGMKWTCTRCIIRWTNNNDFRFVSCYTFSCPIDTDVQENR
jgi:hypothetical protein